MAKTRPKRTAKKNTVKTSSKDTGQLLFDIQIFDSLPDPTVIIDTDYKIIRSNRAMNKLLEESPPALKDRQCYLCLHDTKKPPEDCPHIKALKDGKEHTSEYHENKFNMHFLVTAKPLKNKSGRTIGTLHIMKDITERKYAEESLRKSEAKFKAIVEISNDGIVFCNPDATVTFQSSSYNRINGFTDNERIGQSGFDLIHPDDIKRVREMWDQVLKDPATPHRMEYRARHKDGSWRWMDSSAQNLMDNPYIRQIVVTVRDITDRKLAEVALRESEQRVRAKLDAILRPDGDIDQLELPDIINIPEIQTLMDKFYYLTHIAIAIVDNLGNVLVATGWQDICTKFHRVNPITCKNCLESDTLLSTGIEPGHYKLYKCKNNMWDIATPIFVGKKHMGNLFLGQFFFSDEKPDREQFISQARQYGFKENEYLEALDRVPIWNRNTIDEVMAFYIRFAGMVSSLSYNNIRLAQALSEQKRTEQEYLDLNRTLEEKVANAINEIREKDQMMILQSRQAAMGEMLGNIAHQWRQPLNAMGILIQNLLEFEIAGKLNRTYLENNVIRSMDLILHMSRTIDDFRNFFKPNKAKTVFSLKSAVESALSFVSASLKDHGINISVDCDNDISVSGYPNEFSQVLLNIFNNTLDAVKERNPADPHIIVRIFQDGKRSVMSIADNAGGIGDDALGKVFDPFFTTKEMGTGIGLYMAKTIIEKNMGGKLNARNTGNGAEFIIEL